MTTDDDLLTPEQEQILEELGQDMSPIINSLSDMERKYCQILILQKPKSKSSALRQAGSKAKDAYLAKLAWGIEQKPEVQKYLEYLRKQVQIEANLNVNEIISNCRRAIEMAFENGKPKDADGAMRLLAEIGGFTKTTPGPTINNNQLAIGGKDSVFASESIEGDILRLRQITGLIEN